MFGLGMPELVIILVIVVIIFGAGKLPEIGAGLGKAITSFKKGLQDVESTGKADKCNLCGGDTPECVAFCPTQCLTLDEEDKPLRQKMLRFVNTMKDGQMEV